MFGELYQFAKSAKGMIQDGAITVKNKNIKSISSYSSRSIFYFPMAVSDLATFEEVKMIVRSMEKQYAAFVVACISLIPFYRIPAGGSLSIEDYLRTFHQNIGISTTFELSDFLETAARYNKVEVSEIDEAMAESALSQWWNESMATDYTVVERTLSHIKSIVETMGDKDHLDPVSRVVLNRYYKSINNEAIAIDDVSDLPEEEQKAPAEGYKYAVRLESEPTKGSRSSSVSDGKVFQDRELFTSSEMKKANEMIPTLVRANIAFIVGDDDTVIRQEIVIGIKTYVHKVSSRDMLEDISHAVNGNRKFLKFIKFISGEERSLADLLFGINQIKTDTAFAKARGVEKNMLSMAKKRGRIAGLQVPYVMKKYTPNMTYCITSNESAKLKSEYGIDILTGDTVAKIMSENFALAFIILDQTNESAYISYEGHNYQFQEIPYSYLEREATESDRMVRQMYRDLAGRR